MNKIFFDVGANYGTNSIPLAEADPNLTVYAFEPTPFLINHLKSKTQHLSNYHIIEKAVSDFNGTAIFNVAGNADWGCSSLLTFSDKSKTDWPGRTDFNVTEQINVSVIRLDTFIEMNNIKKYRLFTHRYTRKRFESFKWSWGIYFNSQRRRNGSRIQN